MKPSNSLAPRSGERAGERGRRSARTCAHGNTPLPCPLPASRGEGVRAPEIWCAREFVRQGSGARESSIWRAREFVRGSSSEQTLRALKAAPSNSLAPRSGERAGERGRRSARTCAHGNTPLPCPLPASRGEGVRAPEIWCAREFVRQGSGARESSIWRAREFVRGEGVPGPYANRSRNSAVSSGASPPKVGDARRYARGRPDAAPDRRNPSRHARRRGRRGSGSCRASEAEVAMPVRSTRRARSIPRYA